MSTTYSLQNNTTTFRLCQDRETAVKNANTKGPEERLLSMTTAVINIGLCYCTTLLKWLDEKKDETEAAGFQISKIESKLDKLKNDLNTQTTVDEIEVNIITPLVKLLLAIAQKRKNIIPQLSLKQACFLCVIVEALIKSSKVLLESQERDEQSLNEFATYLYEIKQKIEDTDISLNYTFTALGVSITTVSVGLVGYLHSHMSINRVAVVAVTSGAVAGYLIGYFKSWWDISNIKKQGKTDAEELLDRYEKEQP